MSSQGSRSRSSSRESRSPSQKRQNKPSKLFVTNLDANTDLRKQQDQLKELFSKYGEIAACSVRRSHNNDYSFAFIDYKEGEDASEALRKLNGVAFGERNMKVQLQDNSRRRKANGGQCYKCGKPGHFARECRSSRGDDRRRSRSRSKDHKKKKSHRHRSESSQSRHHKKKEKKKHKSKKSKKSSKKKHYSSDSESSS